MGDTSDFAMALAALVESFAVKDFTPIRVRAYEDGLKDVPIPLVNAAVRKAIQTRTFFPKVSELRLDAEICRKELISAYPYVGCVACEDRKGWVPIEVDGVTRMTRCTCFTVHQDKLARLGVGQTHIALPAARESEWTPAGDLA